MAPTKIPSAASSGATTAATVNIPRSTLSRQGSGVPAAGIAPDTVGSRAIEVASSAAMPSLRPRARRGDQGAAFRLDGVQRRGRG